VGGTVNSSTDLALSERARLDTRLTVAIARPWRSLRLVPSASITGFVARVSPAGGYGPPGGGPRTFDVAWLGVAECEDDEQIFHGSLDVVVDGTVAETRRVRINVPAHPASDPVDLMCLPWDHLDEPACTPVLAGHCATALLSRRS
jgi:hypothetical protein